MRRAPVVTPTEAQRRTLERWARGRRVPARLVERAHIVLRAAQGKGNKEIAEELGLTPNTVGRWRRRFAQRGLVSIERDLPRGGRPADAEVARRIVVATTQRKPPHATHWSTRTLAAHLGVSRSRVQRVWKAARLQPHRARLFKVSTDPQFVEKLRDVVGLYLNPPEHALVLCADEKSQIQALDRTQPGLPMKRGRCGTWTHDYTRSGTTTLFAAMGLLEGTVIGTCMPRHRHQEWLKFLKLIEAHTPPELDLHLIIDNYSTHKHPRVKRWLERRRRFHMHFTPTSCSWLNLVERFLRELTHKRIRRGTFRSVPQLIAAIADSIACHNKNPKPFTWTAKPDNILEKVKRANATLINVKQRESLH